MVVVNLLCACVAVKVDGEEVATMGLLRRTNEVFLNELKVGPLKNDEATMYEELGMKIRSSVTHYNNSAHP